MVVIRVCIGSACHIRGSYNVIQTFQQMIEEYSLHDKVDFSGIFCMKKCQNVGVSVSVDGEYFRVAPEQARAFFKENVLARVSA